MQLKKIAIQFLTFLYVSFSLSLSLTLIRNIFDLIKYKGKSTNHCKQTKCYIDISLIFVIKERVYSILFVFSYSLVLIRGYLYFSLIE